MCLGVFNIMVIHIIYYTQETLIDKPVTLDRILTEFMSIIPQKNPRE